MSRLFKWISCSDALHHLLLCFTLFGLFNHSISRLVLLLCFSFQLIYACYCITDSPSSTITNHHTSCIKTHLQPIHTTIEATTNTLRNNSNNNNNRGEEDTTTTTMCHQTTTDTTTTPLVVLHPPHHQVPTEESIPPTNVPTPP